MAENIIITRQSDGTWQGAFTSTGTRTVLQVVREENAPLFLKISLDNGLHNVIYQPPKDYKDQILSIDIAEGALITVVSHSAVTKASYSASALDYYTKAEIDEMVVDSVKFKGWFDSSSALSAAYPSPKVGDYAYIKGASASDPAAIYECATAGTWADSGRTVDTSNVNTFKTSEPLNQVSIVNMISDNDSHDILSAQQGMKQGQMLRDITLEETKIDVIYGINAFDGFLRSDGTIVSSTGGYITVDVSNIKRVRFLGLLPNNNASTSGFAFYKIENNEEIVIEGYSWNYDTELGETTTKEYIVDVPNDATIFRTVFKSGTIQTLETNFYCYVETGGTVGEIANKITGGERYVPVDANLVANKCWRTDGNVKAYTSLSGCYAGILENVANRKFKVFGNYYADVIPLVFFRNIRGVLLENGQIIGKHRDGIEFVAPSDAYFMQINFASYNSVQDRVLELLTVDYGLEQKINLKLYGTEEYELLTPILYDGYWLNTNNGINYNTGITGCKCFYLENVKSGEKYRVYGQNSASVSIVLFKDKYGNIVTNGSAPSSNNVTYTTVPFVASVPENAYYMCVTYYNYDSNVNKIEKLVNTSNGIEDVAKKANYQSLCGAPLVGKNIVFFGDSITEFTQRGKGVPAWFEEFSGADVTSGAIGGTRLVPRPVSETYNPLDIPNMIDAWIAGDFTDQRSAANNTNDWKKYIRIIDELAKTTPLTTDIVMIGGGTNDMSSNSPIGLETDLSPISMLGSISYIITQLLTANPKLKIYFYSPVVGKHGNDEFDDTYVFLSGKTKPEYIELLKEQTKKYHVPYIDLYWSLGWNERNFSAYFTSDNTHPYEGFDVIARRLYGQVCSLMQ